MKVILATAIQGVFNIMSRGLKWFFSFIITVFTAVGAVLFLVRSHDGPMEILSGGRFQTGELVAASDDWSLIVFFISDIRCCPGNT